QSVAVALMTACHSSTALPVDAATSGAVAPVPAVGAVLFALNDMLGMAMLARSVGWSGGQKVRRCRTSRVNCLHDAPNAVRYYIAKRPRILLQFHAGVSSRGLPCARNH